MSDAVRVSRDSLLKLAAQARSIINPPGQIPPSALAGERISRQQGRGLNFDSLRRYQPGDDVRLMDWQATARMRTPWIRLYNEEKERPVFLLVDQRRDMFFSTRVQTKRWRRQKLPRCWHGAAGTTVTAWAARYLVTKTTRCAPVARRTRPCPTFWTTSSSITTPSPTPILMKRQIRCRWPICCATACRLISTGSWVAVISDFHDLDNQCDALLAALRRRGEISAFG